VGAVETLALANCIGNREIPPLLHFDAYLIKEFLIENIHEW